MAEININDYVRDIDGFIVKVNEIQEYKEEDDIWYQEKTLKGTWKSMIVKHSKNIKDLIKHGDYVNGEFVWLSNGFYIPEGKMFVGDLEQGHYLDEIEVKTILTKEQYEANCYKVKEE